MPEAEERYFVLDGVTWAPDGSVLSPIVQAGAGRIQSRFFSVDMAEREDMVLRVLAS